MAVAVSRLGNAESVTASVQRALRRVAPTGGAWCQWVLFTGVLLALAVS